MERRDRELNPIGWYKPLPKQLLAHQSTAPFRLLTGGNRSGKTQWGVNELIWWLLGSHPYRQVPKDVTGIVSSESFEVQRNTIEQGLEDWAPRNNSIKLVYNRDEKWAEGPNGKIIFKSSEQGWRAYQGIALDFFWMDEEQDVEIYKQLMKRLKAGSPLQAWFTLTPEPDRADHWTYDELAVPALEGRGDVAHFELDLDDNRTSRGGFIEDAEIDRLIAATPVEDRPAVIHGKYVKRGGLVYPMWSREHHVAPAKPLKSFLDAVRDGVYTPFAALDWGVRNPTAILLFVEDKDENVHLIDEIYKPADDVDDIKNEYKKKFAVFNPIFVISDPSIWHNHDSIDPSRTIAGQLSRDEPGLPGLPLEKGDNDMTNGLAAVRDLLRVDPVKGPKLHVQPHCVNFIREIENYVGDEWASTPASRNKKEQPRKKGDHAMDALRYFAMSPHRWIMPKNKRLKPDVYINPVTGYMRAAV